MTLNACNGSSWFVTGYVGGQSKKEIDILTVRRQNKVKPGESGRQVRAVGTVPHAPPRCNVG